MQNALKNIVWLASYPKSGNTWFRVFLQNLFQNTDEPINLNQLHLTPSSSDRELFDRYAGTNSSDLTVKEIRNYRPEVYKRLSCENDGVVYFKVHDAWEYNSMGNPIFPKEATKAVFYFIRNPLEISVSFAHHSNISITKSIKRMLDPNYGLCIDRNKLYNQLPQKLLSWSQHVSSWIEQSGLPIHIMRFEDMLADPLCTFSEALAFIGLDLPKRKILKAINLSKFEILQELEEANGFIEKTIESSSFFRNGTNDTWKILLSKDEINIIIHENYRFMKRFGYVE